METSIIHELLPRFKERNHVLVLLVGVQSFTSRWLRLVEAQASAAGSGGSPAELDVRLQPDEGLIFCLLGMISFSRHLEAAMAAASQRPREGLSDAQGDPAWSDLRGLLR